MKLGRKISYIRLKNSLNIIYLKWTDATQKVAEVSQNTVNQTFNQSIFIEKQNVKIERLQLTNHIIVNIKDVKLKIKYSKYFKDLEEDVVYLFLICVNRLLKVIYKHELNNENFKKNIGCTWN